MRDESDVELSEEQLNEIKRIADDDSGTSSGVSAFKIVLFVIVCIIGLLIGLKFCGGFKYIAKRIKSSKDEHSDTRRDIEVGDAQRRRKLSGIDKWYALNKDIV